MDIKIWPSVTALAAAWVDSLQETLGKENVQVTAKPVFKVPKNGWEQHVVMIKSKDGSDPVQLVVSAMDSNLEAVWVQGADDGGFLFLDKPDNPVQYHVCKDQCSWDKMQDSFKEYVKNKLL